MGLTVIQVTEEISYGSIFKVTILSEFVFFIPKIVKYTWFALQDGGYTYQDVQNFNPFSVYGLLNANQIAIWLVYPLKFLNIFELIYIVILMSGISTIFKLKTKKIGLTVTLSYLSLMFLWICLRIYLSTIF